MVWPNCFLVPSDLTAIRAPADGSISVGIEIRLDLRRQAGEGSSHFLRNCRGLRPGLAIPKAADIGCYLLFAHQIVQFPDLCIGFSRKQDREQVSEVMDEIRVRHAPVARQQPDTGAPARLSAAALLEDLALAIGRRWYDAENLGHLSRFQPIASEPQAGKGSQGPRLRFRRGRCRSRHPYRP